MPLLAHRRKLKIDSCLAGFIFGQVVLAASPLHATETATSCMAGELPEFSMPKEFVRPKVPLACWRGPREGDGRGISFKARIDVTPAGKTENIEIEYSDPKCAAEYLEVMLSELQYECSELGRKRMRLRMTISSP